MESIAKNHGPNKVNGDRPISALGRVAKSQRALCKYYIHNFEFSLECIFSIWKSAKTINSQFEIISVPNIISTLKKLVSTNQ